MIPKLLLIWKSSNPILWNQNVLLCHIFHQMEVRFENHIESYFWYIVPDVEVHDYSEYVNYSYYK